VRDAAHLAAASAGDDVYAWAPPKPLYDGAKRGFDVVLAALALVLLGPVWLAIAAAIRGTSHGPALFSGIVAGRGGRLFTYYKYRTMVSGDDSHHRAWLRDFVQNDLPYDGAQFKVRDDPRVTSLGRWLRRLSLDEVPQLLNVVKGDMSIVGPRPPIVYEFELYDRSAKRRLAVRPGITGLYQVSARSTVPFSQMVAIDLDYIRRRSLLLDGQIMLRTVYVMLAGRGAG
jgi:lipopolysaccharide/colanic/teichoic acid biosynthesis glycosyltransferase